MNIPIDKAAHFGIGGLITTIITLIAIIQENELSDRVILLAPFIGHIVTFMVSYVKELIIDDYKNWKDIWAAMIGSLVVHISVVIGILFKI